MTVRKKTTLLVAHVTATPPSMDIGVAEVDRMHRARGWNGCGYHYVIRRNGKVEKGRPENQIGAHVAGFNSISLGVSCVGGVDEQGKPQDNRTPEQERALVALLKKLAKKYPDAKVCGHRDLSPDRDGDGIIEPHEHLKACPCFDAIPWAAANGLPAADIRGIWDAQTGAPVAPAGPDDRIVYLQKLLKRAGYEFGPIDGIKGPKTEKALKRFQEAVPLPVTGEFDPETVARLREMFEAARPAPVVVEKEIKTPVPVTPPSLEKPWWQSKEVIGPVLTGGLFGGIGTFFEKFGGIPFENLALLLGAGIVTLVVVLLILRRRDQKSVQRVERAIVEGKAIKDGAGNVGWTVR